MVIINKWLENHAKETKRMAQTYVSEDVSVKKSEDDSMVHPIESNEENTIMKFNSYIILGVYVVVILLGITTGYFLSKNGVGTTKLSPETSVLSPGKAVGSTDMTTFKDSATGVIEKGGSDGEGTHKLIREGGPSQTAYLISSVVDLDEYVGMKVKIWGQTMAAKKVSWLMDVGKLEKITE